MKYIVKSTDYRNGFCFDINGLCPKLTCTEVCIGNCSVVCTGNCSNQYNVNN